jgi:hypothetical protein
MPVNISYLRGRDRRISSSRPALAEVVRSYLKSKTQTEGLGVELKK